MKIKTRELTGATLDWAVATCERKVDTGPFGEPACIEGELHLYYLGTTLDATYSPSTDWAEGGPIIEREKIATQFWRSEGEWEALIKGGFFASRGPTPLIAAMRCYVASKLGDEVEVPDELV